MKTDRVTLSALLLKHAVHAAHNFSSMHFLKVVEEHCCCDSLDSIRFYARMFTRELFSYSLSHIITLSFMGVSAMWRCGHGADVVFGVSYNTAGNTHCHSLHFLVRLFAHFTWIVYTSCWCSCWHQWKNCVSLHTIHNLEMRSHKVVWGAPSGSVWSWISQHKSFPLCTIYWFD